METLNSNSRKVFFWEVCPRQSMGFLPSGGQCTSKAPRKSVFGQGAAAQPASCPAICGIEKGDGRIKRRCRWAPGTQAKLLYLLFKPSRQGRNGNAGLAPVRIAATSHTILQTP